ncbi:MAG: phosphoglucosamine mutase [Verrucomicrobiales bacterium]|jgi:phosphoglucosamine mutase|nr:phosphoglucosamine mutase [Verrucomicrobiales bacterium]
MSVKRKWFGTDGIRGRYEIEPMTPEFVWRIGNAAAKHFGKEKKEPVFIVGRDTRSSGYVLEDSLCRGLLAGGAQVTRLGVVPSGAVSMLANSMGVNAGIMISASHNDYQDNGIKFFDSKGFKLADEDELAIEQIIGEVHEVPPLSHDVPAVMEFSAEPIYLEMYKEALDKTVSSDFTLQDRTIVLDAANGAAWNSAVYILKNYGATVKQIGCRPDGININKSCGSMHPEALQAEVKKYGNAIGIALDGDADRLILVDEAGEALDGDEYLAIIGTAFLKRNELPKKTIVATVMSNLGLDEAVENAGGKVVRTEVGDRYVLEKMREEGYVFGGEQSGHFLFLEHAPSGDGLLSALQILDVCRTSGRPLKELRKVMKKYPQKLYNLPVSEKKPLEQLPAVQTAIKDAEQKLGSKGRLFIRYSGTENKIRVLLENASDNGLEQLAQPVLQAIRDSIGAR